MTDTRPDAPPSGRIAAASTRIDTLGTQPAKGARRITTATIDKFGKLLFEQLRDEDPALRTAYLGPD